jgi:hypothetical protein
MSELIETSYEREVLFSAIGAPFETKDILKGNAYRWNPEERVWQKTVFAKKIEIEREFLKENIYRGGVSKHREDIIQD